MIENENEQKEEEKKEIFIPESDLNEASQERIPLCSIYWILSIICWFLFLLTGYSAVILKIILAVNNYDESIIWSIIDLERKYKKTFDTYLEMRMHNIIIISLFIIIMIFATLQFIYFLIKSTCKRDNDIYDIMMGKRKKFHFIPLFFSSCLFGVGIFYNIHRYDQRTSLYGDDLLNTVLSINYICPIISLIIYSSLLIIFDKEDFGKESFFKYLLFRKGTFSCLLIISRYSTIINIYFFVWNSLLKDLDTNSILFVVLLFGPIIFIIYLVSYQIIFGLLNIYFIVKYKDIVIGFLNILIHAGMILESFSFYNIKEILYHWALYFYIIFIIASLVSIIYVIRKMKAN